MSDENLYAPLPARQRLSDQVSRQIQKLIIEGVLQPGERLPPERDLAEQFNVSRTVIREATRSLAAKGLVTVAAGSGARISVPAASLAAESIGLILQLKVGENLIPQLFEVRRLLEAEIAQRAAERRSDAALAELAAIFQQMEESADVAQYAELDVAFHECLARATQNEIYPILLDSVVDILLETRRIALTDPAVVHSAQAYHAAILEAITEGDGAAARRIMIEHLNDGEAHMRLVLAGRQAAERTDNDGGE